MEHKFTRELHESRVNFPGTEQTLVHELGHTALWSVTGMDRQPATRLVDEGWASLLEHVGKDEEANMSAVIQETKEEGNFEEATVDWRIHGREAADSYAKLIASSSVLPPDALQQKALQWEGEQFGRALFRATGFQSVDEAKAAFRKWLEQ